MATDLTGLKTLVAFVFKTKSQMETYLKDGKIQGFEYIGIAGIAAEVIPLIKETLPSIKIKKLTAAEIKEVVDHVVSEFSLPKNKALETQIKKSIEWIFTTQELIKGWKTLK